MTHFPGKDMNGTKMEDRDAKHQILGHNGAMKNSNMDGVDRNLVHQTRIQLGCKGCTGGTLG